jgi:hypothetical protein
MQILFDYVMFKDDIWITIVENHEHYTEKFGSKLGEIVNDLGTFFTKQKISQNLDNYKQYKERIV